MARRQAQTRGRKAGSRNSGYWFRKGRGWYVTEGDRQVPLCGKDGDHIKDNEIPTETLKDAYAAYRLAKQDGDKLANTGDGAVILRVCQDYLDFAKTNQKEATYTKRGEFLFDLCFGLPCRFWDYGGKRKPTATPTKADKIHEGYGAMTVAEFLPLHCQKWLDAHNRWGKGTRRMAIQSLKRAFSYAVEMGAIPHNPIKGFKAPVGNTRVTFLTPEQENAICEISKKSFQVAFQVLIRTGARYSSEFCRLTPKHVEETDKGMVWRFSASEAKTAKLRTIFVPKEIAEITRDLMRHCKPNEQIFWNSHGKPWNKESISSAFERAVKRLQNKGVTFDDDVCLYSAAIWRGARCAFGKHAKCFWGGIGERGGGPPGGGGASAAVRVGFATGFPSGLTWNDAGPELCGARRGLGEGRPRASCCPEWTGRSGAR